MTSSAGGRRERGSVTAEFAVILPVAVALLTGALTTAIVVDGHGRLVLAAATAARAFGRGDDHEAARAAAAVAPGAQIVRSESDGLVCVTAERSGPIGLLPTVLRSAWSCAASGGR